MSQNKEPERTVCYTCETVTKTLRIHNVHYDSEMLLLLLNKLNINTDLSINIYTLP